MGDASIRVTIDPTAAKAEADKLRKELEKLDEMRKKAQEERERALRGEQAVVSGQPDPNAPGGQRSATTVGPTQSGITPSGAEDPTGRTSGGRKTSERIGEYFGAAMKAARTAAEATKVAGGFTSYLKKLFGGTALEGPANAVDAAAQKAAEFVNKLEAGRDAFHDTVTDVVDFNIAALKLGGKIPADQDEIVKDFAEINYQQGLLRKDIDLATKRAIYEVMPAAFAATFNR